MLAGGSGAATNPFYSDPARRREVAEAGAIVGTPEEVVERLRRLESMGIEQVLFTRTTVEVLRRFAAEVMPAFPACGARPNPAQ
jgi:alkanesulfonate monooxygenase SsuD/methylene tetrahydromethanopterin reductase-like flavin-dependent oxidoreductase (luciferase family)